MLTKILIVAGGSLLIGAPLLSDMYFEPEAGATLVRTSELEFAIDVDDIEVTVMGQTMSPEEMMDDAPEMGGEVELAFDVTDEIAESTRGRVLDFTRSFGEMLVNGEEFEGEDGDEGPENVRFTWQEESSNYDIEVLDEDASDATLAIAQTLLAEMDFQHLLPADGVEADESWDVTLGMEGMLPFFLPGMSFEGLFDVIAQQAAEEEPAAEDVVRALGAEFGDLFDSTDVTLTYVGEEDGDEGRLAKIEFSFETDGTFDASELVEQAIAAAGDQGEDMPEMSVELSIEISTLGEGTLRWNQAANRMESLEMNGEFELDLTADVLANVPDMGEIPFNAEGAWSGTYAAAHSVAAE